MTDLTLRVNKVIIDRGFAGIVPVFALVGAATVGFYTVIAISKVSTMLKEGK